MDIYFEENYGKLYEKMEGGKQEIFTFSCEYGKVRHQFIKRTINGEWFDLITPYGYGGPVIVETTNKEALDGPKMDCRLRPETAVGLVTT